MAIISDKSQYTSPHRNLCMVTVTHEKVEAENRTRIATNYTNVITASNHVHSLVLVYERTFEERKKWLIWNEDHAFGETQTYGNPWTLFMVYYCQQRWGVDTSNAVDRDKLQRCCQQTEDHVFLSSEPSCGCLNDLKQQTRTSHTNLSRVILGPSLRSEGSSSINYIPQNRTITRHDYRTLPTYACA